MTDVHEIKEDNRYRFRLFREWTPGGAELAWVMLNPSTADAVTDDPTIRRCVFYSQREGFGRLAVYNLFTLRATNPIALLTASDPAHRADELLRELRGREVVCAWGAAKIADTRGVAVAHMLRAQGCRLFALGFTRSGAPKHPLYLKNSAPLVAWEPL